MSQLNREHNYDSVDRYGTYSKNNHRRNYMGRRNSIGNINKNQNEGYPGRLAQSTSQQQITKPKRLPHLDNGTQEYWFANNNDELGYRHQSTGTSQQKNSTVVLDSQKHIQVKINQHRQYIEQLKAQRAQLQGLGESQYEFSNYKEDSFRSPTWHNARVDHFEKRQNYLNRNRMYNYSQPQLMGLMPLVHEPAPQYFPEIEEGPQKFNNQYALDEPMQEAEALQALQFTKEEIDTINLMRKNKRVTRPMQSPIHQQPTYAPIAKVPAQSIIEMGSLGSRELLQISQSASTDNLSVRKPPLVLNQDLADKKKRLKKSMANRAPSSRRRHFGRTRSHFTFNLDEKTSEEDFEFSKRIIRPRRRRIRSPRTRKYAVDLWAYITQNLMAKNERKSQKGSKKEEHNWENMVQSKGLIVPNYSKQKELKIVGSWSRLINGIKTKKMDDVKTRHLAICAKWARLARLMVRHQANISHLNAIGKWGYLAEVLLKKSVREKQSQIDERWKLLVKGMNDRDPDSFSLRRLESINLKEIVQKLEKANAIQERWDALISGLRTKGFKDVIMGDKQRQLALYGRWNRLITGQNAKFNKREAMKISVKWNRLTRRLLLAYYKKQAEEANFLRVQNFARKYVYYRNRLQTMKSRTRWSNFTRKLLNKQNKKSAMKISVKWNYLSNKILAKQRKTESMRRSMKWRYMAQKYVMKHRKNQCLQRRFKWVYLARKLLLKKQADDNTVEKRWARLAVKIKSRLLMDALYRVQIYDNWTTLTSKIRMLDVKRKFLEQSNHWYRFTKAVRMKDLKIKIDDMLAIQAEEDRREAVIYKRWFVMVSGLRRNKLQFQFHLSSSHWLRFTMGQRKAALKDRVDGLRLIELEEEVASIGNGWLIFTVDVVRNKCFNKDYWIRFTMQLKLRDMQQQIEDSKSTFRYSTDAPGNRWRSIITKLRFSVMEQKLDELQKQDANFRASTNLSRLARLYVMHVQSQEARAKHFRATTKVAYLARKYLAKCSREDSQKVAVKWSKLARQLLRNFENNRSRGRRLTFAGRWYSIIQKLLDREQQIQQQETANWKALIHEQQKKKGRIQLRWNILMSKLHLMNLGATQESGAKSKQALHATPSNKVNSKVDYSSGKHQPVRKEVLARWQNLTSRLRIKHQMGWMIGVERQNQILKRWKKLMGALLRKNPSIGFNRKFINKLRKQMSHDSKNPTVYEERWKRLVTGMLYQSNQADIQIRIKKFVQNCRDMSQQNTRTSVSTQQYNSSSKKPHFIEDEGSSRRSRVENVKLRTVKVKNPEKVKQQLQESKTNLRSQMNSTQQMPVAPPLNNQDEEDAFSQLQNYNKILLLEQQSLKSKLSHHTQLLSQSKAEMDLKNQRLSQDLALGKQRENKLMFFLYVLKEKKNWFVNDVFEEYVKPIETDRFTADYGGDFKLVLKKIKERQENEKKCEKVYGKALRKMRLLTVGKEYQSDSCLPIYSADKDLGEESKYRIKEETVGTSSKPRHRSHFPDAMMLKNGRKVVNLMNYHNKNQVQIPTFDLIKLGQNQRVPVLNRFVHGQADNRIQGQPTMNTHETPGFGAPQNEANQDLQDLQQYASSSSGEDSKAAKVKIKDIVCEPRQRKRLLDSLNIVTPRHKRNALEE